MDTSFISSVLLLLLLNISTLTLSNLTFDQDSMLAFKNAITSDPSGVLIKNWSMNRSVCSWTGVSCSIENPRAITALNISGFALQGTLPPHLGNLTFLQSLDISFNSFTGSIPSELSNLRLLNVLNVRLNNLTGEIPTGILTDMPVLTEVDLRDNQLSGQLPNDMCRNSSKLQRIFLSRNHVYGKIPASIYNCRMLEDLRLSANQLSGNIPPEIGNLTMLTSLALSSNVLEGNIPSSIFNISVLEYVELLNNGLSGSIPIFNSLPKLEELYLNHNNLTGSIPEEIGSLISLNTVVLSENQLTGPIPKQVGNLTSLIMLDVAFNKLEGELPHELGHLPYLGVLAAPFNDFLNGSIPSSIFNISTLTALALQQNQFSGSLPPTTGVSLLNLNRLSLYFNRLTGEIPIFIANASNLILLELNRNSFTGPIPDFGNLRILQQLRLWENNLTGDLGFLNSLTNCRDLSDLEISYNPLNGVLPSSIGNLSDSLVTFAASSCNIGGVIPSEITNLRSLQALDLSGNRLTGIIPEIGKLEQLHKLYLDENRIQGLIPINICGITNLIDLYLSNNLLTGPVPECLGEVKSLRKVSFASNKLNSTLSLNIPDLILLDLSSNSLSGHLPYQIGILKAINNLDLSSNQFSGEIPDSIQGCESLNSLSLSNNLLTGPIPESLGEVKGLTRLDLSSNQLSGSIPISFEKLDLDYFNVSYNRLEGKIPDGGNFTNFSVESFAHNSALCGSPRFQVPSCDHTRSRNVGSVMKYIFPPFTAFLVLVIVIVFLIRRFRRKQMTPAPSADVSSVGAPWKIISEREIAVATSSFSEINLLGKGSFGSVFKAVVGDETVAVKVFNLELEGASRSFDTESRILSAIRHRNLVRILGCCSNTDTQFKALILAYMPNGSLDKWLHSDKFGLDLVQRLNIAIDVALALEYLHHDHTFTVVHCDLKPNNVLLDEDMTAHVADFGISKLFDNGETEAHTVTLATIGYAAPELGSHGKISTSMDVYSYGILLLEMFTSKKPTDDNFNGEMSMKQWVDKGLRENGISGVVTPGLLSREDRQFAAKEQCLLSIFDVAMKCLANLPEERVNMMQVVACLQKLKVALEGVKRKHSGSR